MEPWRSAALCKQHPRCRRYLCRAYIRLPPRPAGAVSRPRAIVFLRTGLGFGAVRVSFLEAAAALVRPALGAAVCLPLCVDRFHPKQPGCRVVIPSATHSSAAAKQRPGAARSARITITITITTSWLGLDGLGVRAYEKSGLEALAGCCRWSAVPAMSCWTDCPGAGAGSGCPGWTSCCRWCGEGGWQGLAVATFS